MYVNRRLAPLNAAVLVAGLLTSPLAARTTSSARATETVDHSRIRIDNFGRVNVNYYRGAQPKGRDYRDLGTLGIKTVINLASADADPTEKVMVEQAGLSYIQIPMTTHTPPTAVQLAEFLKVVDDPAQQPVYVHCVGGRHRTGVMTALYRMTGQHWTADQAFAEMKTYKYGADFLHPEFKQFVYAYQVSESVRIAASTDVGVRRTVSRSVAMDDGMCHEPRHDDEQDDECSDHQHPHFDGPVAIHRDLP